MTNKIERMELIGTVNQSTQGFLTDISHRKQASEASMETGRSYADLFEGIPVPLYRTTFSGKILDANPAMVQMLGYPDLSTLKKTGVAAVRDQEDWKRLCEILRREDIVRHFEIRLFRYDGTSIWARDTMRAYKDKQGRILYLEGSLEDVTARKKSEKALREREASLRSIVMAAPIGIGLCRDRIFSWVSPEFESMVGYNQGGLIGRSARVLYESDAEFERVGCVKYGEIARRGVGDINTRFMRKDGQVIDIHLRSAPMDPSDLSKGVTFSAMDITERKRAAERLKDSEEKYRLLVNNSQDAIFIVQDDVVKFCNPRTEDMTGYSAAELAEMSFDCLIRPEDKAAFKDGRNKGVQDQGDGNGIALRIRNRKGDILWGHLTTTEAAWEGRSAVLHFLRDITLQKELEVQLQQAQKMEAIGALAGGIAHDFNNILGAIMGYTEMAVLDSSDAFKVRYCIEQVLKASHRARDLVKQILAFSRQGEREKRPVQINPILKETLKMLRAFLPSTIEIRQRLGPETAIVEADPTQVHQVLMNLCTNAHYAMREKGGVLEIGMSSLELGAKDAACYDRDLAPGAYLKIAVKDTGEGMSPETMSRVFDPYYTTKEKGVGTGMGMAVAHGIMKEHGGAIGVQSEPGKGTTFEVLFPMAEKIVDLPKSEEGPFQNGNEHVLMVDDEVALLELAKEMLEKLGYLVSTRSSPLEALEAFRANPDRFDIVITDMTMPNMTGDVLAKKIMEIRPEIPVILCTGYSAYITEAKAKNMGIRELVMKPVLIRELGVTIRRLLDQR
ncbi:MAG: PAS domain-containing hybrid sensor histidine kinase/response regulator [Desulfatiglandales bacterium]